ncbi:MAG TPA: O-antigen ligase family protein [Candidatus Saccharimonadales bacterium]|nr:O-antigen ligase family protein [Candidatus Saccharimonadales bacterium]
MDGLIFLYFAIFPFGKLLGVIPDLVILIITTFFLLEKRKIKKNGLFVVFVFSLLFSLSFFKVSQIVVGFSYLVRFIGYFIFIDVIHERFGVKNKRRDLIFNTLIIIGLFVAIFGWIQYLIFPDLRILKTIGWDDHYFRLASTFLDPAFTGIILVLAEIIVIIKTLTKHSVFNYLLNLFLIITILFTYSRASYLAFLFAVIFLIVKFKKRFLVFLMVLFLVLIPFLPKASSEGTDLKRTYSVNQKVINYQESIELIKISPIFGLGFDNLCVSKQIFLNNQNVTSHTCSGLDNSILFIIATTGIAGLAVFIWQIYKIISNTKLDLYGWGIIASFVAVFIHGMFTNTFFYSFVMGWMATLIGITRSTKFKD